MYRGKVHTLDSLLVNIYNFLYVFGRCFIQIKSVFNVYIFEYVCSLEMDLQYVLCVLPLELVLFSIYIILQN